MTNNLNDNQVSDQCWKEWIAKKAVANAGVVLVNSENEVLLLFKEKRGEWENPSGCIDYNEKPICTALRELKEETGIQLLANQLKEIITVTAFHQDKTDVVNTFLAYPVTNKHVMLSSEHTRFQWLTLQQYNNESIKMHEATRLQLKKACELIFGTRMPQP